MKRSAKFHPILMLAFPYVLLFHTVAAADFFEIAQLLPDAGSTSAEFGEAVAVSGTTIVVGAPSSDIAAEDSGAVFVYSLDRHGVWQATATLLPRDPDTTKGFGAAVGVDGNKIVVSAKRYPGGAFLYERVGGIWTEMQDLIPTDVSGPELIGAVAIHGRTIVVGAPQSAEENGLACIFALAEDGRWAHQQTIAPMGVEGRGQFGFGESVAIHENTIVVGYPREDYQGAVYIFERASQGWQQSQRLSDDEIWPLDRFGDSVAIDGDTIVIGAPDDNETEEESGSAYIFERTEERWTRKQNIAPDNGGIFHHFGCAVAVDSGAIAIGARGYGGRDYFRRGSGTAYIYSRPDAVWLESQQVEASDAEDIGSFGKAIAMSGDLLVVGAGQIRGELSGNEKAYVFERQANLQIIQVDVKPGNERNVINPRSKGRFWVAILSDESFDALQVDPETVAFGPGAASPDGNRVKHINRDRMPDLLLRFRTSDVDLQCGDKDLELTGETYAGDSITGTDAVKTVGCKKKPKKGKKK